ncbi:MerR family transcriptional regulator [Kitasatospora sp. A2-31]|uniref:MerR family transcriptional regulator n=1 Tax=Kitasatospora sp. A2-31 TaxID=2916414 RepID=UPI001EED9317|nr:MerR family transcriptional regulator [Kitasatospora sp. A2-31]MCG6499448.1 MerR family transcriptional regulator [Kitasatospora sp. A2-31]
MDPLLTGPESARLAGVNPATIRQWKRRGLIQPDGLDEHGRPMYRQMTIARAERATRDRAGRRIAA